MITIRSKVALREEVVSPYNPRASEYGYMAYRNEVADIVGNSIELLWLVVEVVEFALLRQCKDHVGPIPDRGERQQVFNVGVHSVNSRS